VPGPRESVEETGGRIVRRIRSIARVFRRLRELIRGRPALIVGAGRLEEGRARKIEIGDVPAGTGVELILCRVDGKLFALDALCPHEGGRIVDGPLGEGRYVTCPLHNYHFDATNGKARGVACRPARTYRAREVGDDCEVWI